MLHMGILVVLMFYVYKIQDPNYVLLYYNASVLQFLTVTIESNKKIGN